MQGYILKSQRSLAIQNDLNYVKMLEKAGMPKRQADMDSRFEKVHSEMDSRFEKVHSEMNHKFDQLESKLTIKLGSIMAASIAVVASMIKFF